MANTCPVPPRAPPALSFQLRQEASGGDLLGAVEQWPGLDPFARTEAVVLVHGYNNSFDQAHQAYNAFRDRQYGFSTIVAPGLEALLIDTYWPGDWGLISSILYAVDLSTAKKAAPLIAAHLGSMPNVRIVHFLAHSMGCRLVLEALDILRNTPTLTVGKVSLMAAAVPATMVAPGGQLADAIASPQSVQVLFSSADHVLHYYFPPGESSAGEGFFPTALGREPPALPSNTAKIQVAMADHSDYWPSTDTPQPYATNQANLLNHAFFGFDSMAARQVSTRQPAYAAPTPSSRVAAVARDVG